MQDPYEPNSKPCPNLMIRSTYAKYGIYAAFFLFLGLACLAIGPKASAAESIVSANKYTTASSVLSATYGAEQATDLSVQTYWLPATPSLPQWLNVDLGQTYNVQQTSLTFLHSSSYYQYKIEASVDNVHWSTFADRTTNSLIAYPRYTDTGSVWARYMRMTVTGSGVPGDLPGVAQFAVYTDPAAVALLSSHKTTSASSNFNSIWNADKAVDGNPSTSWAPANNDLPQWLAVDLGQNRTVQRIETTFDDSGETYRYLIEFSINGTQWYSFANRSANASPCGMYCTDEGSVSARYLRLSVLGTATPGHYVRVPEFQIYGPGDSSDDSFPDNNTITQLVLNNAAYSLNVGSTSSASVQAYLAGGGSISVPNGVVYTTGNSAIASVNAATGLITANTAGTTTLTASYNGFTATATITVSASSVLSIAATDYSYSLNIGDYRSLNITAYNSNGLTSNVTGTSTYSSSNTSAVIVNSNGSLSAVGSGSSTITISYQGKTTNVYVTVNDSSVTTLSFNTSSLTMSINQSNSFQLYAYSANYVSTDVKSSASYTSSNTSIATATSSGYIYAYSPGTVTLTATYGGSTATMTVTVTGDIDQQAPTWNYGEQPTVQVLGPSSITLSWNAATDNVAVTQYRIYQDNALFTTLSGTSLSYSVYNLTPNQSYTFAVEAGDAAANVSTKLSVSAATNDADFDAQAPDLGPPSYFSYDKPTAIPTVNQLKYDANGNTYTQATFDLAAFKQALQSASYSSEQQVVINVTGGSRAAVVDLPSDVFLADTGASSLSVAIQLDQAALRLPVSLLHQWALTVNGFSPITVAIRDADATASDAARQLATEENSLLLLNEPVQFSVQVGGAEVTDFAGTYVEHVLQLPYGTDANQATALWINPDKRSWGFVPSTLSNVNGQTSLIVKAPYDGLFTVVHSQPKTFADMASHWAQTDVENLAARKIVSGTSADSFAPNEFVTRSQFAAMIVRSLGLDYLAENTEAAAFSDVQANAWYAPTLSVALKYGLISGYSDNTFHPDERISREQMSVMIQKAVIAAGHSLYPSGEAYLTLYQDEQSIDSWARDAVAFSLEQGFLQGVSDTALAPKQQATRAQASTVLNRLLNYLQFL